MLKSGFRSKDFLVQRSHRNYRPETGRKSNEAKQMRFLYLTYNVVLLYRKRKKSIFHRKSTGRFLHGMPLKLANQGRRSDSGARAKNKASERAGKKGGETGGDNEGTPVKLILKSPCRPF